MSTIINFTINNNNYTLSHKEVEAIYLFGSYARKDYDAFSDIDFFVLISNCNENEYIETKKSIAEQLKIPLDWLSLYRLNKTNEMIKYGSYFLWHLKIEGIKLYDKNDLFYNKLLNIPEYTRAKEDLVEYSQIYQDITKSIEIDLSTISYELNLIAAIIRNASIAVAHMNGIHLFGRYDSVLYCIKTYPSIYSFRADEFIDLYYYRLIYNRSSIKVIELVPTKDYVMYWLTYVSEILELAFKIYREGDKNYE